jgi:hypothetical protein
VSVFDKAKQVARDAAEQASDGARQVAGQAGRAAADVAARAAVTARDPETQEKARHALAEAGRQAKGAAGAARRGVATVIERIEPGTLADVIIRATAIQEKTNEALRRKGSLYRIAEIQISASIPPGINFAIGRLEEEPGAGTGGLASVDLIGAEAAAPVLALDGADDAMAPESATGDEGL